MMHSCIHCIHCIHCWTMLGADTRFPSNVNCQSCPASCVSFRIGEDMHALRFVDADTVLLCFPFQPHIECGQHDQGEQG